MIPVIFSRILSLFGLVVINKILYKESFFFQESARILNPIVNEYSQLIQNYNPKTDDQKKAIENQVLFVEMAYWLGLENLPLLKILDLGGKAGLFSYICKSYGHEAISTDLPEVLQFSPNKELLELMKVPSVPLKIMPFIPIEIGGAKVDLITGFRTRFHSRMPHETGNDYEEHWGIAEWEFFLKDLANNVLSSSGRIFLMLNPLQERDKSAEIPPDIANLFIEYGASLRQNFLYFPNVNKLRK